MRLNILSFPTIVLGIRDWDVEKKKKNTIKEKMNKIDQIVQVDYRGCLLGPHGHFWNWVSPACEQMLDTPFAFLKINRTTLRNIICYD